MLFVISTTAVHSPASPALLGPILAENEQKNSPAFLLLILTSVTPAKIDLIWETHQSLNTHWINGWQASHLKVRLISTCHCQITF